MYLMLAVIVYSSILLAAESVPEAQSTNFRLWVISDVICSVIFTIGEDFNLIFTQKIVSDSKLAFKSTSFGLSHAPQTSLQNGTF